VCHLQVCKLVEDNSACLTRLTTLSLCNVFLAVVRLFSLKGDVVSFVNGGDTNPLLTLLKTLLFYTLCTQIAK
jgi:hypothetical protein